MSLRRGCILLIASAAAGCLFPSLDGLDEGADANAADSAPDVLPSDSGLDAPKDAAVKDAKANDAPTDSQPPPIPIAVVQSHGTSTFGAPASVVVTLQDPQTQGDLNVVAMSWVSTLTGKVTSVTDSDGNLYQIGVGSFASQTVGHALYFAKNIKGGATPNVVTVVLNETADSGVEDPDVLVVELGGLGPSPVLGTTNQSSGNSTTALSGNIVTSAPNELLVAGAAADYSASFSDAGNFKPITVSGSAARDLLGYQVAQTAGTYSANASLPSGYWVMQIMSLKP